MNDRQTEIIAELERFIRWAYEHIQIHVVDMRSVLHKE